MTRIMLLLSVGLTLGASASVGAGASTQEFAKEVERVLPPERPYDFHRHLAAAPVHVARRVADARPAADEMALPDSGWKLVWNPNGGDLLRNAVLDFQDYLKVSMGVQVELEERGSLDGWQDIARSVVVGTRDQLPGCGEKLKGPKDYRICVTPGRVTVCGYDERGAMFGLYNLEARMNLREAPFLRSGLDTVRHSLYDARMAQSWMGWMEFPDALLSRMAHDGFDAIYASPMANPNGDRTTAETSTDFYARILHRIRRQDPARMHDLVRRASKHGIKVYAPIIYQYLGTPESEEGLRKLVRDIVREFPDIRGYVLLTEGFWYKKWGSGHRAGREYLEDWARNWCRAVGIVAEECHRIDPSIEILPWEYNIDFRPKNVGIKRYFIQQLPQETVPLLTWENGTGLDFDGFSGWVRDYSISQVGPAECTAAQIEEAHRRKMRVFTNGDTFVCGAQLQTVPYQPFPYQWHARYKAMERHGVNGTMESWTSGYSPSVMTELRGWCCWSDAPRLDELLGAIAAREFGAENRDAVLKAWKLFSQAIRLVPDTGPYMGTSNAVGNPIFFREPPLRTGSCLHSWSYDPAVTAEIDRADGTNPHWPFTCARMVFIPDFENKVNRAERYARFVSGVEAAKDRPYLPTFLRHLRLAADKMEEGLRLYRAAALGSPSAKRPSALKEVVVAEQIQRMLESDHAILEFEDLRLKWVAARDAQEADALLGRMTSILRGEIERTERSLLAATRDSRLGFQQETDYVYTPYSLREKLDSMRKTLERELPCASLRDRIWLWGHDALSFQGTDLGKRLGERHLDIPEACERLGIPNACVVRWRGLPAEPFEEYCEKLSALRSFGWSVADGDKAISFSNKADRVVELAGRFPNLTTVWLDGWFEVDTIRQPVSELVKLRARLQALPQKPKLTVVFQSHEFDKNPKPDFDACDQVSFWLWHASDIPRADELFARCRGIAGPDKPILIAITLWDMAKNAPLEQGLMQAQLDFATRKLGAGEAAGLVVHCSPLADCDLESVALLREWLAAGVSPRP